ncbi:MAG: hypothetical protein ABIM89_08055 [Mycobacteriales bacterium]
MAESSPRMRISVRAVLDALLLGLIPLAGSVLTMVVGYRYREGYFRPATFFIEGTPFLVAAVAFPAGLPIWVATGRRTKIAVVVAMTLVAAIAAGIVVAADDLEAGLPFVWVVFIALPLAAVVALAQLARTVQPRQWGARRTQD